MIERFAVPDQLTCYYDRPAEPANVHVEVRVPGRLNESAIRASVQAVLAAEPGLRARRSPAGGWRHSYYWEFPAAPDADPVLAATHADQPGLDAQRDAFLSQAPPLDLSPPLRFLLTSGPGGDCLILSAHHARFDGLSCLRLLRCVAGEYGTRAAAAGRAPLPAADSGRQPAAGRTAPGPARTAPGSARTAPGLARTALGAAPAAAEHRAPAARVPRPGGGRIARIESGQGGSGRSLPGYGAHLMSWDGLAVSDRLRACGASVNDLLISALVLTIADWNESRDPRRGRGGSIRITMPVGERAQGGQDGQWANRSRLTAATVSASSAARPADLLGEVARQTGRAKERQGAQVGLASRILATAPVPVAAKHLILRAALRIAGPLFCDTSLVSNLGQVEAPAFGAMTAAEIWFSTSAHMPRGLSLGAVTAGGSLRLTFRYRRALFSAADAAEFAARYAKALGQFAGPRAGWR